MNQTVADITVFVNIHKKSVYHTTSIFAEKYIIQLLDGYVGSAFRNNSRNAIKHYFLLSHWAAYRAERYYRRYSLSLCCIKYQISVAPGTTLSPNRFPGMRNCLRGGRSLR